MLWLEIKCERTSRNPDNRLYKKGILVNSNIVGGEAAYFSRDLTERILCVFPSFLHFSSLRTQRSKSPNSRYGSQMRIIWSHKKWSEVLKLLLISVLIDMLESYIGRISLNAKKIIFGNLTRSYMKVQENWSKFSTLPTLYVRQLVSHQSWEIAYTSFYFYIKCKKR